METRANYALIGIFTLAVIAGAFGFLIWFSGVDQSGGRKTYKIVFTGSIAGLTKNGVVLFNGVPVGAVTKIDLMPQDPSRVYALIDVDENVPVRADTKAQLEFTGFTGVGSVALTGGASDAPPLKTSAQEPGVIIAERSQFQDLIATAQKIAAQASDFFEKTNHLFDENSASVTASVKNVQKFSDALAANSDGIKDLTVKLDTLVSDADNALKGMGPEVAEAAKSIKRVADDLDSRMKEIAANLTRFTGSGLRQYEALAVDGRKTLEELNHAVRSIESNPQQFLFGKSPQVPEYSGGR
jgi:phospholipid/cholesterol/gamma-HCH transport system substrate-binding protein